MAYDENEGMMRRGLVGLGTDDFHDDFHVHPGEKTCLVSIGSQAQNVAALYSNVAVSMLQGLGLMSQ